MSTNTSNSTSKEESLTLRIVFRAGMFLWCLAILCFVYNAGKQSAQNSAAAENAPKKLICQSRDIATGNSILQEEAPRSWQARNTNDSHVGALENDVNCSRLNGHHDIRVLLENGPKGYERPYRVSTEPICRQ